MHLHELQEQLSLHRAKIETRKVLCIGDLMLDRFIDGSVSRISPESPTPVFNFRSENVFPGGAANVARNISSLGATCTLIGVAGDDETAITLFSAIESNTGVQPILIQATDRPTTVKTRFVSRGHHLLRVDHEIAQPVQADTEDALLLRACAEIPSHDVVILSDYAKGVLTDRVVREVIRCAREYGKPVVVDPKSNDFSKYGSATVITPNAGETFAACGVYPSDDGLAEVAGQRCLEMSGAEAILVTRSEQGMSLITKDQNPVHIPSRVTEVADVVGAGDTVIATLSLALAAEFELQGAAILANCAGGIVVGKSGTSTVTLDEITKALSLNSQSKNHEEKFVIDQLSLSERLKEARLQGKVVGFTNGCFDIIHPGHVSLLKFARAHCDFLVVGLNSDASVKRLKGESRPINGEVERATVISALESVDAVYLFHEDTPLELISYIAPDVLIKGADYSIENVVGSDFVISRGGKVILAELVPGASTTNTIKKAKLGVQ